MHAQASKQVSKQASLVLAQIHTVEDAGDAETETTQPLLTAYLRAAHAFHATVANSRSSSRRAPRIAMGPMRAGVEADDQGRWAVRGIRAVRRLEGRRGRPLDVLVEWEGEDSVSDGDLWEESWVSVTELTADLRAEARQLQRDLFGPCPGPIASHRADRRAVTAQRQERERDAQQWRARLRDRARLRSDRVRLARTTD